MYGAYFLVYAGFIHAMYSTCLGLCFSLHLDMHSLWANCNTQTGLPNILILMQMKLRNLNKSA